jgi:hypothetical protein
MNKKERQGVDIGDPSVRFGGRTLEIRIQINTDESLDDVVARICPAAKGPGHRMVVVSGGEVRPDAAQKFWAGVLPRVAHEAKKGGVT